VAQRMVANHLGVFLFNGGRFLFGGLILLPVVWKNLRYKRKDLPWVAAAGLLLFTASALQQQGLRSTTAANAGFITGLYVVMIPLLMAVLWKSPIRTTAWAGTRFRRGS